MGDERISNGSVGMDFLPTGNEYFFVVNYIRSKSNKNNI